MFPGSVTKFFQGNSHYLSPYSDLLLPELVPYPHGSQTFQLTWTDKAKRPSAHLLFPVSSLSDNELGDTLKIRHGQIKMVCTRVPQEQKENLTGTFIDILMQEKELPKMRANPRTGLGCTTTCLFRKLWRLPLFISEHIHDTFFKVLFFFFFKRPFECWYWQGSQDFQQNNESDPQKALLMS